jgi:hypothetical protein
MGSKAPKEGRCGAKNRDGTFCLSWPVPGHEHCKRHGGNLIAVRVSNGNGVGLRSKQWANLGEAGVERLAYLLADPQLLDPKQPVALARYLLEESLIEPTPEGVEKVAKRLASQDGKRVDDAYRAQARSMILSEARKHLQTYNRTQQDALKVERQRVAVVGVVVPVLERVAKSLTEIAAQFITDEHDRERFLEAVRNRLRAGIGEATATVEDAEGRWAK